MLLRRLMITLLAAATALTPSLAAAAEDGDGPLHRNREGFWSVTRHSDGVCSAWAAVGDGGFMLNAHGGAFGVVASDGTRLKGKSAQVVTDVGTVSFKAATDPDSGDLYADNVLNQDAVAKLKTAKSIAVTLDDMLVVGFDTAGTGLPQLVDDLAACGRGEKGWWDAPVQASVDNKEGSWNLFGSDALCIAGSESADGQRFFISESPDGQRTLGIRPAPKGRLDRVIIESQEFWAPLPLTRDGDYAESGPLDARLNFLLRRATGLFMYLDDKEMLNMKVEGTGYPQILDDLAACAAGKSGWWGDGTKPAAH